MALYPNNFNGQDTLQPGARGSKFASQVPGHRDDEANRMNRTNMKLNTSAHDVPNIKYQFDYRLPVLFKYGYAFGFNQMVIPKGRIVAVDPHMDLVDFDMKKQHNTMTLANGGVPVKIRTEEDKYPAATTDAEIFSAINDGNSVVNGVGTEWTPLIGLAAAYTPLCFRGLEESAKTQLTKLHSIDADTGRVKVTATDAIVDTIRPGNIPIGMMQRNEYTRDDNALNGMMPGPVLTDALVEVPWFAYKDKAEENPWGSAYGGLFPGALVKSDENGRITLSPLSIDEALTGTGGTPEAMTIAEYEAERQQVIGQVYAINKELVPEGAARWATWALEDRMNFDEFNPAVWSQNNRRGEDAVNNSPHHSSGNYPGYPYDKAYKDSDLHMLASTGRLNNYDMRMNMEHQYENLGIPGLTDGKNVYTRTIAPIAAGVINKAAAGVDYVDMFFRANDVDLKNMDLVIGGTTFANISVTNTELGDTGLTIKYADNRQGIIVLTVTDREKLEAAMSTANALDVKIGFKKAGLGGVPTFLDWDGVIGSIKVLLTK